MLDELPLLFGIDGTLARRAEMNAQLTGIGFGDRFQTHVGERDLAVHALGPVVQTVQMDDELAGGRHPEDDLVARPGRIGRGRRGRTDDARGRAELEEGPRGAGAGAARARAEPPQRARRQVESLREARAPRSARLDEGSVAQAGLRRIFHANRGFGTGAVVAMKRPTGEAVVE